MRAKWNWTISSKHQAAATSLLNSIQFIQFCKKMDCWLRATEEPNVLISLVYRFVNIFIHFRFRHFILHWFAYCFHSFFMFIFFWNTPVENSDACVHITDMLCAFACLLKIFYRTQQNKIKITSNTYKERKELYKWLDSPFGLYRWWPSLITIGAVIFSLT